MNLELGPTPDRRDIILEDKHKVAIAEFLNLQISVLDCLTGNKEPQGYEGKGTIDLDGIGECVIWVNKNASRVYVQYT